MSWPANRSLICYAPEGTGQGGAPAAGAAASPAGAAGAPAGGAASTAPWYGDKIDEVTRGFWQNKGIDINDPVVVASKLTDMYRNAEGKIGAPPEEMIRIPKANAAEADIRAYWGRIGVPPEAKDYDLSTVKFADGKELDTAFADMLRAALHEGRVPKDRAAMVGQRIVKQQESEAAAALSARTAIIRTEREALDKNWGTNKVYNEQIAMRALQDLGKAAGLTAEQTKAGWDAISAGQHIGASFAMEMLRTIGARLNTSPTGESPFLGGTQPGQANGVMSQAQARAKIDELKMDTAWYKRLMAGGSAEKNEWTNLHKIGFGASGRAA